MSSSANGRFQDKVAIVTGGCNGIGRGCADILAEQGGRVAVLDVDETEGAKLSSVKTAGELFYVPCDVRKEENIKNAIEEVVSKYGRIDCLVNNVGTHPGLLKIDELTVDSFEDLLKVNLVSHFAASKYALPYLRETKGSIVSISSVSGTSGSGMSPTYCATKGGIVGLTKALSIDEAKNGVRINAIAPAGVDTPLLRKVEKGKKKGPITQEQLDYVGSYHLLGRIADPREIGLACLYLAVDATFTTGEVLMCTAGSDVGYGIKA